MMSILKKIFYYCFSLILPQPPDIELLEKLSPAEFAASVAKPLESPPGSIRCLYKYKDPTVRKALWTLKYRGNRKIARLFASLLHDELIETLADENLFNTFARPLIIPVPLSKERLRERGWNQTEMICQALVKLQPDFELQTKNLLKIKHTKPQTRLSRTQRLNNLKNCFVVKNPEKIQGRNIVLIDDVTTTGRTLEEAQQTLLKHGARRVLAFAIAH